MKENKIKGRNETGKAVGREGMEERERVRETGGRDDGQREMVKERK